MVNRNVVLAVKPVPDVEGQPYHRESDRGEIIQCAEYFPPLVFVGWVVLPSRLALGSHVATPFPQGGSPFVASPCNSPGAPLEKIL